MLVIILAFLLLLSCNDILLAVRWHALRNSSNFSNTTSRSSAFSCSLSTSSSLLSFSSSSSLSLSMAHVTAFLGWRLYIRKNGVYFEDACLEILSGIKVEMKIINTIYQTSNLYAYNTAERCSSQSSLHVSITFFRVVTIV